MAASTYYLKGFCVRCLKDCPRLGGEWRNRMFFCALCAQQAAAKGVQATGRHGCLQTPIPATREPRIPQMNYEPAAASTLTSVVLGGKKQTVGSPIKD